RSCQSRATRHSHSVGGTIKIRHKRSFGLWGGHVLRPALMWGVLGVAACSGEVSTTADGAEASESRVQSPDGGTSDPTAVAEMPNTNTPQGTTSEDGSSQTPSDADSPSEPSDPAVEPDTSSSES